MCPTTPCKFLALRISHGDRVGRLDEAVPDLFEELQPIGNAKRLDLLANGAHGPILHVSVDCRKPHVSTDRHDDFRAVRLTSAAQRGLASSRPEPHVL
jgi:hypothetical protein